MALTTHFDMSVVSYLFCSYFVDVSYGTRATFVKQNANVVALRRSWSHVLEA